MRYAYVSTLVSFCFERLANVILEVAVPLLSYRCCREIDITLRTQSLNVHTYVTRSLFLVCLTRLDSLDDPSKREIGRTKWKGKGETFEDRGWKDDGCVRAKWKKENKLEEESLVEPPWIERDARSGRV